MVSRNAAAAAAAANDSLFLEVTFLVASIATRRPGGDLIKTDINFDRRLFRKMTMHTLKWSIIRLS